MYKLNTRGKSKRRRIIFWLIITILVLLLLLIAFIIIRDRLRPKVAIKQANAVSTKVVYSSQTKHYDEPDFGIDLPATWHAVPRPAGTYESFTWQSSDVVTDGQQIEIYEDVIPVNFAVNRALIVEGETDHVALNGSASDNCATFTKNLSASQVGVPAKWQGVSFLCDQANQQRDVIGTSSTDGVNTVILLDQGTGVKHKFFFTYTDYATNPDYTIFYNALGSFLMN